MLQIGGEISYRYWNRRCFGNAFAIYTPANINIFSKALFINTQSRVLNLPTGRQACPIGGHASGIKALK